MTLDEIGFTNSVIASEAKQSSFFLARWICFASLAMTTLSMLSLLLLLLLTGVQHPPLRQHDRFAQHAEIADVIGEYQNQRRIEIRTLRVAQAAMGLDDQPIGRVGICKIRLR